MESKVAPQVLRGMRDILPDKMILRQYVIGVLRDVFETYGFEPLETPAIEYAEVLEGKSGDEADTLMYKFEDRGGRRVGLRYDLTVPLARVAAAYGDLVKPFKRYQIAPVWRAERPQRGRFREFYQCDVDTVGSRSLMADAEVVAVAQAALSRLGFRRFRIKLNNRKLLTAFGEFAGVPGDRVGGLYRAIDRIDKVGIDAVRRELVDSGIAPDAADRLLALVRVSGEVDQVLASARDTLSALPGALAGVDELSELVMYLREMGIPREQYEIDLSMVRGLGYYTGPIFEAVVDEPKVGSICGGGRYDNLVGVFSNQDLPAVGISVGLERIIEVIEELRLGPKSLGKTLTQVLVSVFAPATLPQSLKLVQELRAAGINSEVYLGTDRLPNQLRYASRKGIRLVLIVGPDEVAAERVVIKDLIDGKQTAVSRAGVATALCAALPG
jgi:histidyl-tRNA synthetase